MQSPLRTHDPRRIGRYELISRLGQGGMGVVYLGRDEAGRQVAVKVLREDLAFDDEFRGRFRSEVSRVRQVPPFCTASVIDADLDHSPPFLVVEYVDGPSLTEVVGSRGPLSAAEVHSMALGIASALTAIHGAGVVHRDLKPDNVLFGMGGVKVIDFGIARPLEMTSQHTMTGQMVGTVAYMAPERFDTDTGPGVVTATDVFAWGAVVTYAATGRTPFAADSPPATAARILTQPPEVDGVPEPLRGLVLRALEKDPRRRPTARELLDLLLPATTSTDVRPPQMSQVAPMAVGKDRSRRRKRAGWATAATVVLAGLAVLGALSVPRLLDRASDEEPVAPAVPGAAPSVAISSEPKPEPTGPFTFTLKGWSDGRLRVSDPITVSTAYQLAALQDPDDEVIGIVTVYRPGAFDPDTLTGADETTLDGRQALWDNDYPVENLPDVLNKLFAWQYADDAWMTVHAYPGDAQPTLGELRALAVEATTADPAPARIPFSMAYVPSGYRPVEVGSHGWTGESGVLSIKDGALGGALFVKPAPKTTGLDAPWDPNAGGPVADNFVIHVTPRESRHRVGVPSCEPDFCGMWAGDGRVHIEVVSGRLTDREMVKVLRGIKLAPVEDDAKWPIAGEALPLSR